MKGIPDVALVRAKTFRSPKNWQGKNQEALLKDAATVYTSSIIFQRIKVKAK